MFTTCKAHRRLPWLGHGICEACEQTFKHILQEGSHCACGSRLLPYAKKGIVEKLFAASAGTGSGSFSARPYCAKCFEEVGRSDVARTEEGGAGSNMFED
jgi:hypothetical protein